MSKICGTDPEQLAKQMFSAGSDLSGKTDEEIFYQDYKVFAVDNKRIGVGQISSVLSEQLQERKPALLSFLQKRHGAVGMDYSYLIMTNILEEKSDVICDCEAGERLLESAFPGCVIRDHCAELKGVVSRKKQFIPSLLAAIKV